MTKPLLALGVALLLIASTTAASDGPPGRVAGHRELGTTSSAHSLTRGHNRKVIYDPGFGHWYVFWLHDGGQPAFDKDKEGVVYQFSVDGLAWSKPVVVEPFKGGGITAFDVVAVGKSLYLLGTTDHPNVSGKVSKYGVRQLNIKPDGTLGIGPPKIVYDNGEGDSTTVHFYGSLLHDSQGHFWVAARVGDSTPDTHADVIRTSQPNSTDAWGPGGAIGRKCNPEWKDPYAGRKLLQGTIASRLLELGPDGVGMVTYNKHGDDTKELPGQLLFVKNPTRAHDGWEAKSIVLADRANQRARARRDKLDRLDDRRFAAVLDPRTRVIHIAYIGLDADDAQNANLRYFTLSPPYTLAAKSAETTVVGKPVDGVHLSIDPRGNPSTVYMFYVANENPNYQVRMARNTGKGWSEPLNISDGKGPVRYPQSPETIVQDEVVVAYQFSEKLPENRLLYHIRAAKVILGPSGPGER